MKDQIKTKALELFLTQGFKTVTTEVIAKNLAISKKTLYKYFENKDVLVRESAELLSEQIYNSIRQIKSKNHNAIEENFEVKKMFRKILKTVDPLSIIEFKIYYPEIYSNLASRENKRYNTHFRENIKKGIGQKLYRSDMNIDTYVNFYHKLLFHIKENSNSKKEFYRLEIELLDYHIRSMATPDGVKELEKQLQIINSDSQNIGDEI